MSQLQSFAQEVNSALWFAEAFGLTPKVLKCTSNEEKSISVPLEQNLNYNSLDSEDKQKLRELIYILDKFSISNPAYHELHTFNKYLPRKRLICQERKNLNDISHIERTPGETPGACVSIKEETIHYIKSKNLDNEIPVKVKLAGDDSKVSRLSGLS